MLYALKWAVGRARPYTEEGKSSFHPFSFNSKYYSFPSGHTSAAFSVASVIAHHSDSLLVDVLAYSLATFVGFARPFQDKHWASDVFFGAALGYFVGQKICACHSGQASKNIDIGLTLTPYQQSLTLSFSF
jgi:membrane-associated phospholipid phosphatase